MKIKGDLILEKGDVMDVESQEISFKRIVIDGCLIGEAKATIIMGDRQLIQFENLIKKYGSRKNKKEDGK